MAIATSTGSGSWSSAIWSGGSGSGGAPADGDAVVIAAGHSVLMNADLSSWIGLTTLTITGHSSSTPGMLYFKDGTSGYLKFRTGTNYGILGTNVTNKGRLLANSDGVWGNTGSLAFTNKSILLFEGTSSLDAQYLDIALYGTEPTNKYAEVYGTAYTCTTQTTDVNASTDVITFSGAPPTAGTPVMVRSSGTLPGGLTEYSVYYTRTISGNTCKLALTNSDETIVDITSTGSGTLTMYSGHTNTSTPTVNVIQNVTTDTPWVTTDGHDAVVLVDYNAPENYDIQALQLTTIDPGGGSITLSANVDSAQFPLARIFLISRNVSIRHSSTSATQSIIKNSVGNIYQCQIMSTSATLACNGLYGSSNNNTISGVIAGCSSGLNSSSNNNTISGVIAGCGYGLNSSSNNTISGVIAGCGSGLYGSSSNNNTISGVIAGCSYVSRAAGKNILQNASSGIPTLYARNTVYLYHRVCCENLDRSAGDSLIVDNFGDVQNTPCDGMGDAPSVDPDGGSGDCIEASSIQSNCGLGDLGLTIIDGMRIWLSAAEHTVTYKVQTNYVGIAADKLQLACAYIGTDGVITRTTNAPAINARTSAADWTQTLAVTFTSTQAGWATFYIVLLEYQSGKNVYVWPKPTIS